MMSFFSLLQTRGVFLKYLDCIIIETLLLKNNKKSLDKKRMCNVIPNITF